MKRKTYGGQKNINYGRVNKPFAAPRAQVNRLPARTLVRAPVRFRQGAYSQYHQGGEIKALDVTNSTTPTTNTTVAWLFNTTPTIQVLNTITTGSSSWNRVGRKISLKSVRVRGSFNITSNAISNSTPQYCRLTILYDKQANGALPVASDVFKDQASVAADSTLTTWLSGINLNNRDRFEVIADKQWMFPNVDTATGVAGGLTASVDTMHIDLFYKLGGRETHFKADSSPAVIGDIASGSLFMITQGNIGAGNEPFQMNAAIRVRYSDL